MQSRAIDLENFLANHPLNFLLFYGNYEVINTIYLDDGSPLVDLSMELFNQSPTQTVKFKPPTNSSASEDNHHFSLSLEGNFTLEKPLVGWDVAVAQNKSNSGNIFYFLKLEGCDLQQKPANGSTDKIVLVLKKFRAAPEGGTRTIRAEMLYGPLLKDKDNECFLDNYGDYYSYGNTIFITNNRGGKKTLPLQVGFATGNAVLNDGTSTNTLELVIANKNWPESNLPLSTDSQFVISFEMGDTAKEGAVATEAQVKGISITTSQSEWNVPSGTGRTEWPVTPKSGTTQLAYDDRIKLEITNLVTSHSSGSGYLYVRYSNIPNYPDGQFVVAIEKTPLLYRGAQVGIGTNNPLAKLHVSGGDAIVSGKLAIGTTNPTIHLAIGDNNTGLNQETEDKLAIYTNGLPRVRIEANEGTNGGAKLHVFGDLYLGKDENNKRFLIHSRTNATGDFVTGDFLQITSDNSDGSWNWNQGITLRRNGNVGIGTDNPQIHLAIGDSDTGLKQEGDGKLAIYTNNAERVRIDNNGNVGIGTTTPSAKLDVHGDFHIKGAKPMEYWKFELNQDNPRTETPYPHNTWIAIVAGFSGFDNSGGNWQATGIKVWPVKDTSSGKWVIECDLGYINNETWKISILFIKKELVKES